MVFITYQCEGVLLKDSVGEQLEHPELCSSIHFYSYRSLVAQHKIISGWPEGWILVDGRLLCDGCQRLNREREGLC